MPSVGYWKPMYAMDTARTDPTETAAFASLLFPKTDTKLKLGFDGSLGIFSSGSTSPPMG